MTGNRIGREIRMAVAAWLRKHPGQPARPSQIADAIGRHVGSVGRVLRQMADDREDVTRLGGRNGPTVKYVYEPTRPAGQSVAVPDVRAAQVPVPPPRLEPAPPPEPEPGANGHGRGTVSPDLLAAGALPPGLLQVVGVASGRSGLGLARDHEGRVWLMTPVG